MGWFHISYSAGASCPAAIPSMTVYPLLLAIQAFSQIDSDNAQSACVGSPSAPALDHAIVVVRDLDSAAAGFQRFGFTIKQGRLHSNNLLNRHIKFRDGSSIELMTVKGAPGDAMASNYSQLLAAGEGGVYVALEVTDLDAVQRATDSLRFATRRSSSGPWRFLGFQPRSPAAVFFTSGGLPANDSDSLVTHEPEVSGLAEAWLEGSDDLRRLLALLGAKSCGIARSPDGRSGHRLGLSNGSVVILPVRGSQRPRVAGVMLAGSGSKEIVRPHSRFWIGYH